MRAEHLHAVGSQVVGVIFHERRAVGQPGGHHLHRAHQRGGFPVALAAEAVAFRHQALNGQAGQLRQAVQILKGIGEALEVAILQECAQAGLDARAVAQRVGAARRRAAALPHIVLVAVLLDQAVDFGIGNLRSITATRSPTP